MTASKGASASPLDVSTGVFITLVFILALLIAWFFIGLWIGLIAVVVVVTVPVMLVFMAAGKWIG